MCLEDYLGGFQFYLDIYLKPGPNGVEVYGPPDRWAAETRHHLSNILTDEGDEPGTYLVRSNCLIYRSRGDQPTYDLVSAQRRDLIRSHGDGFLFVHRWAAIDQSTAGTRNMSFFI